MFVQEMIQRLLGLVAGNGANSYAVGPNSPPYEAQGSVQGRVGVKATTGRDDVPNPTPPVARQVVPPAVDDSSWYIVEKF